MKKAGEYARRLKRVLSRLKAPRMSHPPAADDLAMQLVRSLLLAFSNEPAAGAAFKRLGEATVDMNELRVTPMAELVEALGPAYPNPRPAAESIARVLAGVFNRCHHMDLGFLKQLGKREARKWIETLDGMTPFAAAVTVLRGLGHHAVPIDETVLEWLKAEKLIDPAADMVETGAFLERVISPAKVEPYFHAMRQAATAWAAKRPKPAPAPPPPPPAPVKPDEKAAGKPAGKTAAPPANAAGAKPTGKLSDAAKPGAKPPAVGKPAAGKAAAPKPAAPKAAEKATAVEPAKRTGAAGSGRHSGKRPAAAARTRAKPARSSPRRAAAPKPPRRPRAKHR